ncbi:MAG TPA: hypothetical protein DEB17_01220 [Chlorobaculum sp.]|uniref:Uncharacterized protein n=1 Tax=Chlorobaculum tepidum (strain ATCC 49652 / DSM 12025 / NBRC 103806 / TLS) TaxID=194439 RepID=Q8KCD2_CHLTE|nr:hypothetical protein CT1490 [Chlorobaculum tepidum TLS]HBU22620.1 hypothetical protein [Chlorobaculum sp.]
MASPRTNAICKSNEMKADNIVQPEPFTLRIFSSSP